MAVGPEARTEWLLNQLWPTTPRPNGWAIWAILDGARDPRIYDLVRYSRMERACLYAGNHPEELLRAAPHLIRLSQTTQLTREILTSAWGRSWGVFLSTTAGLEQLRLHLRGFLRVRDQQGRKLVFRYYDPRVLRQYLPTCTGGELNTIFGPIENFVVEGKEGATLLRYHRDRETLATETVTVATTTGRATATR